MGLELSNGAWWAHSWHTPEGDSWLLFSRIQYFVRGLEPMGPYAAHGWLLLGAVLCRRPYPMGLFEVSVSCSEHGILKFSLSYKFYILSLLSSRTFSEPQKEWWKCPGWGWALNLHFSEHLDILDILNGHWSLSRLPFSFNQPQKPICTFVIVLILVLQECLSWSFIFIFSSQTFRFKQIKVMIHFHSFWLFFKLWVQIFLLCN